MLKSIRPAEATPEMSPELRLSPAPIDLAAPTTWETATLALG